MGLQVGTKQVTALAFGPTNVTQVYVTDEEGVETLVWPDVLPEPPTDVSLDMTPASVGDGENITFDVVITGGDVGLTYNFEWFLEDASIPGPDAPQYVRAAVLADNGLGVYCIVTDNFERSYQTDTEVMSVITIGDVTISAPTLIAKDGDTLSFTCTTDAVNPSYQWKFNGSDIGGATSSVYARVVALSDNGDEITCLVTDDVGQELLSNALTMQVEAAPTISISPTTVDKKPGDSQTWTSSASGYGPLTYQWKIGGVNISGATNSSYTRTLLLSDDSKNVTCVVTDALDQSTTSNTSALTVTNTVPNISIQSGEWNRADVEAKGYVYTENIFDATFLNSVGRFHANSTGGTQTLIIDITADKVVSLGNLLTRTANTTFFGNRTRYRVDDGNGTQIRFQDSLETQPVSFTFRPSDFVQPVRLLIYTGTPIYNTGSPYCDVQYFRVEEQLDSAAQSQQVDLSTIPSVDNPGSYESNLDIINEQRAAVGLPPVTDVKDTLP